MDVQYSGFGVGHDRRAFSEAQKRHAYVIEPLFTAFLQPFFQPFSPSHSRYTLLPDLSIFDGVERTFQPSTKKLVALGIELLIILKLTHPYLTLQRSKCSESSKVTRCNILN
jgi:hypothetical protein